MMVTAFAAPPATNEPPARLADTRARALARCLYVASVLVLGALGATACGSSEGTANPPIVSSDAGSDAAAAPSFVFVSPSLGAGSRRIEGIAPAPGNTLLVLSSRRAVGVSAVTPPLELLLNRLDPDGRVRWSVTLGGGPPGARPFATASSTRIAVGTHDADGTNARLRVVDADGIDVASLVIPAPLEALGALPQGGVIGLTRATGEAQAVLSWDGRGSVVSKPWSGAPGGFFVFADTFTVDGKGFAWAASEKAIHRFDASGAVKTIAVKVSTTDRLSGRPGGGVLARSTPDSGPSSHVGLDVEGNEDARWETVSTFRPDYESFETTSDGRPQHVALYTHNRLEVRDLDGSRTKTFTFSVPRGEVAATGLAAGKVWVGGSLRGRLSGRSVVLESGPSEDEMPFLLGFDRYDVLIAP